MAIFAFTTLAAIFAVVGIVHRFVPQTPFLPDSRLRNMPSTPEILGRVGLARRRQVWWASVGALCGLVLGALLLVGSKSVIPDAGWRPEMSLIWVGLFGWVAGTVANLVRNGYAFSDHAGVRVAHSSAMTVRSVVGLPAMIICHLAVSLSVALVIWVTIAAHGRSSVDYPYSQFGDIWTLMTMTVLLVVVAHSLGTRVIRLPSSASTSLELAWDAALKRAVVQDLFTKAVIAAGITALMAGTNSPIRPVPAQYLLMFASITLVITAHILLARSGRPAGAMMSPAPRAADESVRH
ncbi:hypothetical protein [Microlunatus soli]|uniref:Uncharacterized protein n=1 Tax=Microlunatus soli TaxID=630515 RepID=A0A1H1PZ01_9ACTN|nr:hypothetical protein [Microlunatus soli]SDS16452.1 hypothetical protein SAMN04489812_1077 [Microlunatus soli]